MSKYPHLRNNGEAHTSLTAPTAPPMTPEADDLYHGAPPPYNMVVDVLDAIEPQASNRWLFRLALVELLLGISALSAGAVCVVHTEYCPWYTGVWVGPIYFLSAILGVVAAKRNAHNFFLGHLVSAVLSIVGSAILATVSIRNWLIIGVHPYELNEQKEMHCIFDNYDAERFHYVYNRQHKYDYHSCVQEFKLGLSMNSLLAFFAGIELLLNLVSAILCCRRLCKKGCC